MYGGMLACCAVLAHGPKAHSQLWVWLKGVANTKVMILALIGSTV